MARIADRAFPAGEQTLPYDLTGAHLAPGTYLARLASGTQVLVRKLQVLE